MTRRTKLPCVWLLAAIWLFTGVSISASASANTTDAAKDRRPAVARRPSPSPFLLPTSFLAVLRRTRIVAVGILLRDHTVAAMKRVVHSQLPRDLTTRIYR